MAKRDNPVMRAMNRMKQAATTVDSMAMARMPMDFQSVHNLKRKLLAAKKGEKKNAS